MRIGCLSDIHGNAFALEAVLADASRLAIDRWIDLGDSLYGPLEPLKTWRLLRSIGAVSCAGNEDRLVVEAFDAGSTANATARYTIGDLGREPVEWLRTLPRAVSDPAGIAGCHGTPASDTAYLLEDVSTGRMRLRALESIERDLASVAAPLVACGHSHVPRVVELAGGRLAVNPGSVGLQAYDDDRPRPHVVETGGPEASYAVLGSLDGRWLVEHRRVPYDHEAAASLARRNGRGDWARWLATGMAGRARRESA